MKNDYTHITMVLDRSGSMDSMRSDAIGGFNAFLRDQQSAPGKATLTMVQFDDHYDTMYDATPLTMVAPLTEKTFVPRGSTALLDAIGRAIDDTGTQLAKLPESERPAQVLFVTLTDGMENASHVFNRSQIFEKITIQTKEYNWKFVFLAANQDAIQTGASMGFAAGDSATFSGDGAGQQAAMRGISQATTKMRERVVEYAKMASPAPMPSASFFDAEDRAVVEQSDSKK